MQHLRKRWRRRGIGQGTQYKDETMIGELRWCSSWRIISRHVCEVSAYSGWSGGSHCLLWQGEQWLFIGYVFADLKCYVRSDGRIMHTLGSGSKFWQFCIGQCSMLQRVCRGSQYSAPAKTRFSIRSMSIYLSYSSPTLDESVAKVRFFCGDGFSNLVCQVGSSDCELRSPSQTCFRCICFAREIRFHSSSGW